jgi:fructoselysine-6-phosphate deglycase
MFNFNVPRYEGVVNGALALRPQIETAAMEIAKKGYRNIFFIGCGGTYSHSLTMKYTLDTRSTIESYAVTAAEFMLMGHKQFSKDSLCIFSTRSGNTKEIVEAAKFCKDAGAAVVMYVCNAGTPACEYADYLFLSFAEDDNLAEAIYIVNNLLLACLMHARGEFENYEKFADQLGKITPYLVKAKELYEDRCCALAQHNKDTEYYMVVGGGNLWGEAYDYAMCILEEMQWIKTKSIHAAEFFHGTLELVEEGTRLFLLYGEDETRPLMDRVLKFASTITKDIAIFDTAEVELPLDAEFRKIMSPLVIYTILERYSAHIEHVRNHPLTIRRYYRQFSY